MNPALLGNTATLMGIGNPKSGDVGVELEVEGLHLPRVCAGWIVKKEMSLRGEGGRQILDEEDFPDTPLEYVTRGVVTLSRLEELLHRLTKLFQSEEKTKIVLTPRASTHIHVNLTEDTFLTFFSFVTLFAAIEPVLLRLCGHHRNGNLFCLPLSETGEIALTIARYAYILEHYNKNFYLYWLDRGKYASLNLDPMKSFGSVELRCFPNSVSPKDILNWATWAINLRRLARSITPELYKRLVDTYYDNPDLLLYEVFGNTNTFTPCYPHNPKALIHVGLEQSYEISRGVMPLFSDAHKPTKPTVKKEKQSLSYDEIENILQSVPSGLEMPSVQNTSWVLDEAPPALYDDDGSDN